MNRIIATISILALLVAACQDVDFDNISNQVKIDATAAAPAVHGRMVMGDLLSLLADNDTLVVAEGDSLYLVLRSDSVFDINAMDYADLPDYVIRPYYLTNPLGDIPAAILPNRVQFQVNDTYDFIDNTLHNGRRIDSMWFSIADVVFTVTSNFRHGGTLAITCPNIIVQSTGLPFYTTISLDAGNPSYTGSKTEPVDVARVYIDNPGAIGEGFGSLDFIFDVDLVKEPGQGVSAGDQIQVDISFQDITYGKAYGYFGQIQDTGSYTDTLDIGMLDNASGTFAIADPRVILDYTNTIGVPFGADLHMTGQFDDKADVNATGDQLVIWFDEDYRQPEPYTGQSVYRNITNIDQILAFPPPDRIEVSSHMLSNPTGDKTKYNYVTENSAINLDLQVKVPLHLRADLQFVDTLALELTEDSIGEVTFHDAALYFYMENSLPLELEVEAWLYDSIADQKLSSVLVNLLEAAPVNADGTVNMSMVKRVTEVVELTSEQADQVFNVATHVIVQAKLNTTRDGAGNARNVKILKYNGLDFKIGVQGSGTYEGNLSE